MYAVEPTAMNSLHTNRADEIQCRVLFGGMALTLEYYGCLFDT